MYSKVKIGGHPLHVMLVGFPVAFYTATLASFIAYEAGAGLFWFKVAVVANMAGFFCALAAAIPGFIDWAFGIPKAAPAKRIGLFHMISNLIALALFGINILVQFPKWNEINPTAGGAIVLCAFGFLFTAMAGYLGWTLVQTYHVGVKLTPAQEQLEMPSGGAQIPVRHRA